MCECCGRYKKYFNFAIYMVLFVVLVGKLIQGQENDVCLKAKNCDECMRAGPLCHWCEDGNFTLGGRLNRARCGEYETLRQICNSLRYLNDSTNEVTESSEFGAVTQVRPQKVKLSLRSGNTKNFKVTVKPAENFPVDIYFLNDLSHSMEADLKNLQQLANDIASEIGKITKNYRLGFGAFIDKPTQPFIFYPEDYPRFPCTKKQDALGTCPFKRPIFGYAHIFDFSDDTAAFSRAINNTDTSADIDDAEGCLDALMQVVVCEDLIKWKPRQLARRIVMLVTDAEPKLAGDGKLANILQPNDGKCHLKKRTVNNVEELYYEKTLELDYPSVSQLRRVMKEAGVAPILAVDKQFLKYYERIAEDWSELGSAADFLSNDSANIVSLVRDNYNRIATTVSLTDEAPPYLEISFQVDESTCSSPARVVSKSICADVKLNQEIVFDVDVKLKFCPDPLPENPKVNIRIAGFGQVTVDLEYMCECNCIAERLSPKCNNRGTYKCGICECQDGYFGQICQCDASKVSRNDTSRCIDPNNPKTICNGEGECICGQCECKPLQSPKAISGDYCECKNFGCPKAKQSDEEECGGPTRGKCTCGQCGCIPPYKGVNCGDIECTVLKSQTCQQNKIECNGHGKCANCANCTCDPGYAGLYCDKCITQDCKCATVEPDCLRCHLENVTCSEELNCDQHEFIPVYNVTFDSLCLVTYKGCNVKYNFTQEFIHNTSRIWQYSPDSEACIGGLGAGEDTDTLAIILGLIAGILLLGLLLLLLWKLLVTLHDKKEYAKFERAQNDSHWEKDGNPIYREPNQQFVNPAFAGDS